MKRTVVIVGAVALFSFGAHADDDDVTDEQRASIVAALEAIGCKSGEIEVDEDGDGGAFEVEDAECADGKYEIELNKDFEIVKQKRDD